MKTIGLLGGMSWASTAVYYRLLNQEVMQRLGGLRSARVLLASLDFAEVVAGQKAGEWDRLAALLADSARRLERAGADVVLIATNTMHKVADAVEAASGLEVLHIADATAAVVRAQGLTRVGLLATAFTMEDAFYVDRLTQHGIEAVVPGPSGRAEVHRIIYDELVRDVVRPESRGLYRRVMADLVADGAEGMIFGCTEVGLLVGPDDTTVPAFDTCRLHAAAAVDWMLADGPV